jgi:hypothetical protein
MQQLHRRFTDEQVKVLFQGYCQGVLARTEVQEMLDVGKTQFFALLKEYRRDPEGFSIAYERHSPGRLSATLEAEIERELLREKEVVENKDLPISGYNYSALQDRLKKQGYKVSVTTIIERAKQLDCYKPSKKRRVHDREVLTASIGALVQHDSSLHLWSPFAQEKWALITSLMTSAASYCSPISSHKRPPGLIFRPLRPSCRLTASRFAIMLTPCACSASSRAGIVFGASMF